MNETDEHPSLKKNTMRDPHPTSFLGSAASVLQTACPSPQKRVGFPGAVASALADLVYKTLGYKKVERSTYKECNGVWISTKQK